MACLFISKHLWWLTNAICIQKFLASIQSIAIEKVRKERKNIKTTPITALAFSSLLILYVLKQYTCAFDCIHLVILSYITGNFITIHISFYGWQRIRDSLCVILYWLNRLTAGISSAVFWIPCRPITANHSYVEYGIWQNKGAYERDSYGNVYSGSSFSVIYSYHRIEQSTYRNALGFFLWIDQGINV